MKGKRLLVVDDEETIRVLFKEELEEEGFMVDVASGGEEALAMLEETDYDLVILDVKMPGMDGMQTLQEMRKRGRHMPVVLCSAYSEFRTDLTSWLSEAYVVKSSDMRDLKEVIRRLLGESTGV